MNLILDFWTVVQCQAHPSHAGIPAVSPGSVLPGFASPRAHAQEKRHAVWTLAPHRFRAGFLGDITHRDLGMPLLAVLAWGTSLQGPGVPLIPARSFRGSSVPAVFSQLWDLGLLCRDEAS